MHGIISLLRIRNGIKYIIILSLVAMVGCSNEHATSGKDVPVEIVSDESYDTSNPCFELLTFVAGGNLGDSTILNNTPWGDSVEVAILSEYCSALGEICRRLSIAPSDGALAVVVAIKCGNGVWTMAPDISPRQSQPNEFDPLLIGT